MATIELHSRDWAIQRPPATGRPGRRSVAAGAAGTAFPPEFLTDESRVEAEFVAAPRAPARRGAAAAPGALDFSTELAEDEAALVAIRHPSGALTFHLPVESARRGAGRSGRARSSSTSGPPTSRPAAGASSAAR